MSCAAFPSTWTGPARQCPHSASPDTANVRLARSNCSRPHRPALSSSESIRPSSCRESLVHDAPVGGRGGIVFDPAGSPAPPRCSARFVPVTVQFTDHHRELASCKVAWLQIGRPRPSQLPHICRRHESRRSISVRLLKSRLTCQFVGDAPPLNIAHAGVHDSVPAPCTVPYTPTRFPFVPAFPGTSE